MISQYPRWLLILVGIIIALSGVKPILIGQGAWRGHYEEGFPAIALGGALLCVGVCFVWAAIRRKK